MARAVSDTLPVGPGNNRRLRPNLLHSLSQDGQHTHKAIGRLPGVSVGALCSRAPRWRVCNLPRSFVPLQSVSFCHHLPNKAIKRNRVPRSAYLGALGGPLALRQPEKCNQGSRHPWGGVYLDGNS